MARVTKRNKDIFADLGVDDLVHDGFFYDAMNTFDWDLPFYMKWCRRAKGPILELCCGTGRLTIPLAKSGIEIEGLDVCESMLRSAREKAKQAGVDISWHKADMRKFRLPKKYGIIFIPFNSLQNTYRLEDVERIFDNIKRHLRRDGYFILDVFNPSIRLMADRERKSMNQFKGKLPDGRSLIVREQCAYDSATQCNRVTWNFTIDKVKKITQKLDMRCFYPLELDMILKYNGFKIWRKFGDFRENDFSSSSAKQIFVCKVS